MRRRLLSLLLTVVLTLGMLTMAASSEAAPTVKYFNTETGT